MAGDASIFFEVDPLLLGDDRKVTVKTVEGLLLLETLIAVKRLRTAIDKLAPLPTALPERKGKQ